MYMVVTNKSNPYDIKKKEEYVYIWGTKCYIEYCPDQSKSYSLQPGKLMLATKKENTPYQKERFLRKQLSFILRLKIEELLPKWESITGLHCEGWDIGFMTAKWGYCKCLSKKIKFSTYLVHMPIRCVEQVILHELNHITHHRHTKAFYADMTKFMPDWKECVIMLKNRPEQPYVLFDCQNNCPILFWIKKNGHQRKIQRVKNTKYVLDLDPVIPEEPPVRYDLEQALRNGAVSNTGFWVNVIAYTIPIEMTQEVYDGCILSMASFMLGSPGEVMNCLAAAVSENYCKQKGVEALIYVRYGDDVRQVKAVLVSDENGRDVIIVMMPEQKLEDVLSRRSNNE